MTHVFPRVLDRTLPTAVSAEGAWIVDADGGGTSTVPAARSW